MYLAARERPYPLTDTTVHDQEAEGGHDVTEEGLHMDVYRNGEKVKTEQLAPPESAARALTRAE